jgi:hypothetical protein
MKLHEIEGRYAALERDHAACRSLRHGGVVVAVGQALMNARDLAASVETMSKVDRVKLLDLIIDGEFHIYKLAAHP